MNRTIDANTASAMIAYRINEFACIYPITPSSLMAELCDEWSANDVRNVWNKTMKIVEMQSEAGVAGCLHGALLGGAISTTFTASQGLLLMIPNMFKIAGELLPCVINVAARTIATHALSIFGDHSDVMACRTTGFAMLCANNTQEAMDFTMLAEMATFRSSIPFLHFFDGFRTSHEIQKISTIDDDTIRNLLPMKEIDRFRSRSLSSSNPCQMGTNQNPDVFFQNREASNKYYQKLPDIMEECLNKFYEMTDRKYNLFDYYGETDAENIIIMMGSGCETVETTIDDLNKKGEKYGLIKVRLFRPFSSKHLLDALPKSTKCICTLDRCKENAIGEPLYEDIASFMIENNIHSKLLGGRYGLGGKDFTPAMVKSVFDNMKSNSPKNHFAVGIIDDLTNNSLDVSDYRVDLNAKEIVIYGLGSDGTVSANKNSIKIIGESTNFYTQGYFEYDSKKSGSITISHLRISREPIRAPYLIKNPEFVMCNNFDFVEKYDMLSSIKENGSFILNFPYPLSELNDRLPNEIKSIIKSKNLKFYIINAEKIASSVGLKNKINTVMQSSFFHLINIMDIDEAITKQKQAIIDSYGDKGDEVINANFKAIEMAVSEEIFINNSELKISSNNNHYQNSEKNNIYFEKFIKPILARRGNFLPTSAFNADGRVPTGTSSVENRNIAQVLPCWNSDKCIECGFCAISCPHGCIKPIIVKDTDNVPNSFITKAIPNKPGYSMRLQINPTNCTGCGVCSNVCPVNAITMEERNKVKHDELKNYEYSKTVINEQLFDKFTVKGSQLLPTLFEFSAACAGCGETPYIKLLTQLFGDNMIIANATGCSSIYGGTCPTCPYTKNSEGKGPAWANSLFEDNAEFGYGISLAKQIKKEKEAIWIVGGDGWAYDIGYGGLDHILASGENINILVLDTEVYSNTGGQSSKATPMGAVAKFCANGKQTNKKPLGQLAMAYGNVYVAQISLGANMQQSINAMKEAQEYNGVSLIIAYCPCINHGIDMSKSSEIMKQAVTSGYWPLYRFNPDKEVPLSIDSSANFDKYEDYILTQTRYKVLKKNNAENYKKLFKSARTNAEKFSNNLKQKIKD